MSYTESVEHSQRVRSPFVAAGSGGQRPALEHGDFRRHRAFSNGTTLRVPR